MRLAGLIISTLVAVTVAAPAALPVEQAVQSTEAVEAAEAVDAVETVEAAQGNRAVEAVQEAKAPAAGGCSVGFVFARGSTEISPLGTLIGPGLQSALKRQIPGVQTFPVYYAASLGTNISNDRTDAASIQKGVEAFNKAGGCSVLVAGGYSQGAAVMHNVVQKKLSAEMKKKLLAVALFGDTRNKQDGGHIKNFPSDRSRVWCNPTDGVCSGALNVNAYHLSYSNAQINEAAAWLAKAVKSKKQKPS